MRPKSNAEMKVVKDDLTPDELRKFPCFAHLTDEEAEILIEYFRDIARAVFEFQIRQPRDEQFKNAA